MVFVFPRSREDVIAQEQWPQTEPLKTMRMVQQITGASLMAIACLVLVFFAAVSCRDAHRQRAQRTVFILTFAHVVCLAVCGCFILLFGKIEWSNAAWKSCAYLGAMPVLFYVSSAGCTYAIYIKRVQATSSFTKRSQFAESLFFACKLGVYGLPGLLIAVVITMQGELRFKGVCQQAHSWQLAFTFMLMDTLLSLGFLYLFLEPVLQQLRTMDRASAKSISSKRMRHTTRKNLLWSSVAIFSTLIYMIMATAIPATGPVSADEYHWRLLYWAALPIDGVVNLFSTLAITSSIWLPKDYRMFTGVRTRSVTSKTYPAISRREGASTILDSNKPTTEDEAS